MRNLQQNLLLTLALCLCGLCVYQWHAQTVQRIAIQQLERSVYQKAATIQSYTNAIANTDKQVSQMDARITELKAAGKTNAELVASQRREITHFQAVNAGLTNLIAQYTNAVATLERSLREANEGIQKQNASIRALVTQRDELVIKFNDSVKDRNDVVGKYNDLVKQVERIQAASTNAHR